MASSIYALRVLRTPVLLGALPGGSCGCSGSLQAHPTSSEPSPARLRAALLRGGAVGPRGWGGAGASRPSPAAAAGLKHCWKNRTGEAYRGLFFNNFPVTGAQESEIGSLLGKSLGTSFLSEASPG